MPEPSPLNGCRACTVAPYPLPSDAPETLVFDPRHPWLAPLAGWSDLPFRLLCRELGASVCCTEMVSAKGLMYGSPGTVDLLAVHEADTPLVVQLFGSEAPFLGAAARHLLAAGFRWFDCNMGCAVPKVTRTGAGAALGRDPANALECAKALLAEVGKGRVGFKLRLGWDDTRPTWAELALRLQEAGAGWLTLHPRTARQGFTGTADWDAIAELKRLVDIPVIASGDLFTARDGLRCLAHTGADTVMYARGALRNPAIFLDHARLMDGADLPAEPAGAAVLDTIRRHAELARQYSSQKVALLKMRTIVPRYAKHLPSARALRQDLMTCRSWDDFARVLAGVAALPPAGAQDRPENPQPSGHHDERTGR